MKVNKTHLKTTKMDKEKQLQEVIDRIELIIDSTFPDKESEMSIVKRNSLRSYLSYFRTMCLIETHDLIVNERTNFKCPSIQSDVITLNCLHEIANLTKLLK